MIGFLTLLAVLGAVVGLIALLHLLDRGAVTARNRARELRVRDRELELADGFEQRVADLIYDFRDVAEVDAALCDLLELRLNEVRARRAAVRGEDPPELEEGNER